MQNDGSMAILRRNDESELRNNLAQFLRTAGFSIWTEMSNVTDSGRCDIAASTTDEVQLIIETKIADPIRGIGQLFGYSYGFRPRPTLVLALPWDLQHSNLLTAACKEANVELWYVRETGTPVRAVGSRNPRYPEGLISEAVWEIV